MAYPDYMEKTQIYIYIKGPFEVPRGKPRYTLLSPVTYFIIEILRYDKYNQIVNIFYLRIKTYQYETNIYFNFKVIIEHITFLLTYFYILRDIIIYP